MTDSASTVALAPLVQALAPIVVQVAGVIIAAGVTWGAAQLAKTTRVHVQQGALDKLTKAAQAEAGALVASAADNLATAKIDVGSPLVAAAASRIVNSMPEMLDAAGLTPSHVATMVAGEIGQLQARMTTVAPPAPASPKPS